MAAGDLHMEYAGRRSPLLGLTLKTSLLTVLTLGIYRFWMKTRLRRYYWSSIRPGGHPLEYVGQPLEKLLGFLIAVTFLAFYIGIVNLLLMFLSFSLLGTNFWAYGMSLVGILPILFFARYRARRYILARTRWRAIRFGLEPGAWGYAWRALVHWALTILSLGLLWPRMTFWLEKYRTDRTLFGTETFHQGGHWTMLYRPFMPLLFGEVLAAIGGVLLWQENETAGGITLAIGAAIAAYGFGHYRVHSFRMMMNRKTVGDLGFVSRPKSRRIVWIYVFGYFLVALALVLVLTALGTGFVLILVNRGLDLSTDLDAKNIMEIAPLWATTALSVAAYFLIFIIWGALTHVLVTLPVSRHYAQTLTLTGAQSLANVRQRARDELEQAEGFAEALDVGAAI